MNEVDISEQDLLEEMPAVLHALLKDHSRTDFERKKAESEGRALPDDFQRNIIWGTDNYREFDANLKPGAKSRFGERDEITEELITGENRWLVRPRAVKDREIQRQRSKDMAEVFTPSWVCNAQNNLIDEAWFGRPGVFNTEFVDKEGVHRWTPTDGKIAFAEEPSRTSTKSWKDYVRDVRLEITCGEGPYLVSRYDTVTGQPISDLNQRVGILDRKLRVVSENTSKSRDWLRGAQDALKATYGYEWQGDNLLLAREAVLFTVLDYYRARFGKKLEDKKANEKSIKYFAYIISWNLWQMDGLKMVLPYSCHAVAETDLFGTVTSKECPACAKGETTGHNGVTCVIRDWTKKRDEQKIAFEKILPKGSNKIYGGLK